MQYFLLQSGQVQVFVAAQISQIMHPQPLQLIDVGLNEGIIGVAQ